MMVVQLSVDLPPRFIYNADVGVEQNMMKLDDYIVRLHVSLVEMLRRVHTRAQAITSIEDEDGDTIVQTEEAADEDIVRVDTGGTEVGRFDENATAAQTRFMLYDVDNDKLERVSVGAADSGGAGFKVLRIAN